MRKSLNTVQPKRKNSVEVLTRKEVLVVNTDDEVEVAIVVDEVEAVIVVEEVEVTIVVEEVEAAIAVEEVEATIAVGEVEVSIVDRGIENEVEVITEVNIEGQTEVRVAITKEKDVVGVNRILVDLMTVITLKGEFST